MGIIIPEIHTSLTSLQAVLEVNRATLQRLRPRRVLNATHWSKLYPTLATSVSLANFDNNLETESIDPELEAHYEKILEEWKKDEDYRKGMLDKIIREEGNVGKKVDDLAVVPNKGW